MTLIELLVVLSLFAVIASAASLALPSRSSTAQDQLAALRTAADIRNAVAQALRQDTAFAIDVSGDRFQVLEPKPGGGWQAHSDAHLAKVKLFDSAVRIVDQSGQNVFFPVSSRLIPGANAPLRLKFGSGPDAPELIFDGARVRVSSEEGRRYDLVRGERF